MNVEVQGFKFNNVISVTIEDGYISLWADDRCIGSYSLEDFRLKYASDTMEIFHK